MNRKMDTVYSTQTVNLFSTRFKDFRNNYEKLNALVIIWISATNFMLTWTVRD